MDSYPNGAAVKRLPPTSIVILCAALATLPYVSQAKFDERSTDTAADPTIEGSTQDKLSARLDELQKALDALRRMHLAGDARIEELSAKLDKLKSRRSPEASYACRDLQLHRYAEMFRTSYPPKVFRNGEWVTPRKAAAIALSARWKCLNELSDYPNRR